MEKYDFGNRLYEYRTQKGLTQKELGKLLGVTDKAVSKWETGESKPRLDKMNQITELFETSIDGMLGKETADGEQLKPFKTIFETRLEKFSKYYKATRIWTYIFAIISVVILALSYTVKILNGELATEENGYLIGTILIASASIIFTLKFKPKFNECKSRDMNIFMIFSLLLFFLSCAFPIISAVKLGRVTGEYDSFTIGFICAEALILTVIALISFFKKKYTFFMYMLFTCSANGFVVYETLSSLTVLAITIQFACFIEKRNWLDLANKANIEFKKADEEQKATNAFIAIVAIVTVLSIVTSLFSPYITYKILMEKYLPDYKPYEVIDYDYSAKPDKDFTRKEFNGVKIDIPKSFEEYSNSEENPYYNSYKNAENGEIISIEYHPNGKVLMNLYETDIETLEPEKAEKFRKEYAEQRILNSLCKRYYGISTDTFYGAQYIIDFVDLEDVKFYESKKIALLCGFLVLKITNDTGPMSVSSFDNGIYCGLIEGRQITTPDGAKSTVIWSACIWHSNNKDGAFYTVTYYDKSASDITDNQMICKLVNSLEF